MTIRTKRSSATSHHRVAPRPRRGRSHRVVAPGRSSDAGAERRHVPPTTGTPAARSAHSSPRGSRDDHAPRHREARTHARRRRRDPRRHPAQRRRERGRRRRARRAHVRPGAPGGLVPHRHLVWRDAPAEPTDILVSRDRHQRRRAAPRAPAPRAPRVVLSRRRRGPGPGPGRHTTASTSLLTEENKAMTSTPDRPGFGRAIWADVRHNPPLAVAASALRDPVGLPRHVRGVRALRRRRGDRLHRGRGVRGRHGRPRVGRAAAARGPGGVTAPDGRDVRRSGRLRRVRGLVRLRAA